MLQFTINSSMLPVSPAAPAPFAGVVAVIGCDGSGKSTLTTDLAAKLGGKAPTERRYLGLISGEIGDKIKQLPIIGVKFEHYLAAKAQRAQDMRQKLPNTGTALVMYMLSLWRTHKLRKILALSQRGVVVITDRYPQAEIPGFHFDGPGLLATRSDSWLVHKLAAREQKLYQWMADQVPCLVIRLNVDVETALGRKPDHNATELRDKIAVVPKLHYNGARIVDLDAHAPYAQVLDAALQAVRTCLNTPSAEALRRSA